MKLSASQFHGVIDELCRRYHISHHAAYLCARYWPAFSRLDEEGQQAFLHVIGAQWKGGCMDTISVTIGHITKTYVLVETTAPVEYDGFGTITINALSPKRWVLIEQEHLTWQTSRYASGLHSHTVCDGKHLVRAAVQRLWERLVAHDKQ